MAPDNFLCDRRSGPNPRPADRLTAAERRTELCTLLALGLLRLRTRQSSELSGCNEDSSLHFVGGESVCRTDRTGEFR